ncbi:type II secretion system minor pseudopilin GspK [Cupriavidus sp. USMAA2-4]|uniref:type II secretion system minor pseudopilin GspK n=1 Tax=Cupriavidus sp. USMAA2-4 TaxID=876364 RepID=UPI0009FF58C1|nr:type II secretion system minor pseudopilin GspK [Cupriavidus sp. USMAA2-4]
MRPRQRGIAVVTALLIVALVVSLIAGMFVRQGAIVRSLENARLRAQTRWQADSLVEAVRVALQRGAGQSEVDHLGQEWARPLTPARLAALLPPGGGAADEDWRQLWLRGEIEDAQARFNLANLLQQPALGQPFQLDADGIAAYGRLLAGLSLNAGLAPLTAAYLLRARESGRALPMARIEDLLAIPGYTVEMVQRLQRYAVILPERSPVNVNTAGAEVLAAAVPGLSVAQARQLVNARGQAFIQNAGDLENRLRAVAPGITYPLVGRVDVKSGYFIVHCQVRRERASVAVAALVERQRNLARFVVSRIVWVRDEDPGEGA